MSRAKKTPIKKVGVKRAKKTAAELKKELAAVRRQLARATGKAPKRGAKKAPKAKRGKAPKSRPVRAKKAPSRSAKKAPRKVKRGTAKQPRPVKGRLATKPHEARKRKALKKAGKTVPHAKKRAVPRKRPKQERPGFIAPDVVELFSRQSAQWDGTHARNPDGTWNGQIIVPAGPRNYPDRLVFLEEAVSEILIGEQAWLRAGVLFRQPAGRGRTDADKLAARDVFLTYWRRCKFLPYIFAGALSIGDNLASIGNQVSGLVLEIFYGAKPESWDFITRAHGVPPMARKK